MDFDLGRKDINLGGWSSDGLWYCIYNNNNNMGEKNMCLVTSSSGVVIGIVLSELILLFYFTFMFFVCVVYIVFMLRCISVLLMFCLCPFFLWINKNNNNKPLHLF